MTLLAADLERFTGSEKFTPHPLMRDILMTDGAMHIANEGGAFWLMDKIATNQAEPKFAGQDFQVWTLTVGDGNGQLVADDGDERIIHSEPIRTDFPLPKVKLYCVAGTIMLPTEY